MISPSGEILKRTRPAYFSETIISLILYFAAKLKEFNSLLPPDIQCEPADLDTMSQLCDLDISLSNQTLNYLWRILKWPEG